MPIAVVSVPVADQDAARRFYVAMIAFVVVNDQPMGPGMRGLQLPPAIGGATIALVT